MCNLTGGLTVLIYVCLGSHGRVEACAGHLAHEQDDPITISPGAAELTRQGRARPCATHNLEADGYGDETD
jgi:hypothetical protein